MVSEYLYELDSAGIAVGLLALILLANEAGFHIGRRSSRFSIDGAKAQTNAIQAAMLGLLALLLGFTFTIALQRFDSRSEAVIQEANAIGTTYLRSRLLSNEVRAEVRNLIQLYLELRVRAGNVDLTQVDQRREAKETAIRLQDQLWSLALRAAAMDPRPTTSGLFIQSLNDLIDTYGRRSASLEKHVPESVLLLLFAVFIITGAVLGYSGGLVEARAAVATIAMAVLIVVVIFIIIDLDRPRRGLIRVSQDSLIDLQAAIARDAPTGLQDSAQPLGPAGAEAPR